MSGDKEAEATPVQSWSLPKNELGVGDWRFPNLMGLFNPGGDCHEVPQEVVRLGSTG